MSVVAQKVFFREMPGEVRPRFASGALHFSMDWEDYRVLHRALDIRGDHDLLMVAGAGCNVLNLLLAEPRSILAIDRNPAQTALLELKLAAIRVLSHGEVLNVLGFLDTRSRLPLYERLRDHLSMAARAWWDANPALIDMGVHEAGRLDAHFTAFRRVLHADCVSRHSLRQFFRTARWDARRAFVDAVLFTPRFTALFRRFFEQTSSFDERSEPGYREPVHDAVRLLLARLRHTCSALPVRGNFYLRRLLLGDYAGPGSVPPYLRPWFFPRLRTLVDRVSVVTADLGDDGLAKASSRFDGIALSDIQRCAAVDSDDNLLATMSTLARPRARIAFWGAAPGGSLMMSSFRPRLRLSAALNRRDRIWLRGDLIVASKPRPDLLKRRYSSSVEENISPPGNQGAVRRVSSVFSPAQVIALFEELGISHVVTVPDSTIGAWGDALESQSTIRVIRVCREGEAWSVAGGLFLGGATPLVLIQCTGLFESGDSLRNMVHDWQLPLLSVIGYRSYLDQSTLPGDTCLAFTEPVLRAWNLDTMLVTSETELSAARDHLRRCQQSSTPGVLLVAEGKA